MNHLNGIKNLFIDLGGVLINIDFKKTYDAFHELGIQDAYNLNDRPEVLQLFLDFECGKFSPDELLVRLSSLSGYQGNRAPLVSAFCALLRDYKPGVIELVQELTKTYRVFLLSNTNALHAEYFNGKLRAEYGINGFEELMEQAFYSHDLGYRKPDHHIFKKAIKLANVVPQETLFIDDLPDNIVAAEACGLRGVVVDEEYTLVDVFK